YLGTPGHTPERGGRPRQIPTWVAEGPGEAQAVCVGCQNNSVGERCDSCRPGYFMLDGTCTR
ncbi:MEGF8 protein, partial [Aphelocoma coerulescens]|nr:MEGF8 protein [Aphelocoma coerulescens]